MNRIRTGKQTEDDINQLVRRVREKAHPDLKDSKSLWLFGKNKPVDEMNQKRLLQIKKEDIIISAKTFHNTIKNFSPPVSKTGAINNTPFQAKLRLRIGAKIMLTYNINTADGLTNGSRGELKRGEYHLLSISHVLLCIIDGLHHTILPDCLLQHQFHPMNKIFVIL